MSKPNLNKNLLKQNLLKCGKCLAIKSKSDFYKNSANKNTKYDGYCKECRRIANKRSDKPQNDISRKPTTGLEVTPNTPICREVGDVELHIIRERNHNGLTAWCNKFFTSLPLMFVKDVEGQLDLNRVCPTCHKSLVSAGFSLPRFGAPDLRLGWS